jgi:hypothetical protein
MENIQPTTLQDRPIPEGYWAERDWAWEHYAEFITQYPDQWIAVWQQHVVAHGESLIETETIAQEKTGLPQVPVIFVEGRVHVYTY